MTSVVILTKNEEKFLQNCINSVRTCALEIIVIDNGSTDMTVPIAQQNNCTVYHSDEQSFSARRELGLKVAKGEWILYLDADERITPELATEINSISANKISNYNTQPTTYVLNREDYYLGTVWPSISPMHRLFFKQALKGWHGIIHETPIVDGLIGTCKNKIIHLTHVDIDSMLRNTLKWSSYEAQLRFDQNHPPIVWWRLIRVLLTAWFHSFISQKGYTKGTVGWIESLYQGCSMFLTYAKLWELQNKEQISTAYELIEKPYQQKQ